MNPTKSLLDAGVWMSWGSDGVPYYGPRVTLWTGITTAQASRQPFVRR